MRLPGDRIGRYVIVGLLGQGGMGEVYEAEDSLLGRRVALKLIPTGADAEARERMLREARTAASFEHPNVVVVFDVGVVEGATAAGETFLAMELVRGRTLRSMVRDEGISIGKKLRWLVDVARALDAAHGAGLIHRDVKPDNVMVREDGVVKVLDFGIAKKKSTVDPSAPTGVALDPMTLTKAGAIVGTPRYASPEQLRGEPLDGRADQYSWGVTAYELLSGRAPFEADDPVALLSRILSVEPPRLNEIDPAIPDAVDAAIHQTMAKRREDRFPRLGDVAELLEPFADAAFAPGERRSGAGVPSSKTPPASIVSVAPRRKLGRPFWIAGALAAALAALVAAGAVSALHSGPSRDAASAPESANVPSSVLARRPVQCSDARITGPGASPDLAHMMGIGACARLAVNVGVPWAHDKAVDEGVGADRRPLDVEVNLGDRTRVTLTLGGEKGTGESSSPIEAIQAAVKELAARVPVPPMTDAERAAWGASTDESGRRIERVWRRVFVNDLKDPEAEAKALVESDPDSPWSHAIRALFALDGSKTRLDAATDMEARLDRVSGARQKGLRALARVLDRPTPDEALRELRNAYAEGLDPDIAWLYAAMAVQFGSSDEGLAVVDRLAEKFPTRAAVALQNAVNAPRRKDLDRDARYLARLVEVFPEHRCATVRLRHLIEKGELPQARAAVTQCARLFGTAAGEYGFDLDAARVAFAEGDYDAAHDLAVKRLGDPRPSARADAAHVLIAAYLAAGRIVEAEDALKGELARQRDQESPMFAASHARAILRLHRRLGKKPPPEIVGWLADTVEKSTSIFHSSKLTFEVDLALSRGDRPKAVDELLARIEKLDDSDVDLMSLPLVRARRGDKAAVELLRRRSRAGDGAWRYTAVDAALALEATHADADEIRDVLRYLRAPLTGALVPFDAAIAEAILARVCEAEGKHDEAAAHSKALEKRFAKADKGLAEIISKIR